MAVMFESMGASQVLNCIKASCAYVFSVHLSPTEDVWRAVGNHMRRGNMFLEQGDVISAHCVPAASGASQL